jgi:hypothetical protein
MSSVSRHDDGFVHPHPLHHLPGIPDKLALIIGRNLASGEADDIAVRQWRNSGYAVVPLLEYRFYSQTSRNKFSTVSG